MAQSIVHSHYSFGDNELAAARLTLLAQTYERSSFDLLNEVLPPDLGLAIDLGCGLGHTTSLIARTRPTELAAGYDRSPRYLAQAAAVFPDLAFHEQDVLTPPFPHRNADLVYSRFLLTHLHNPEQAIATWKSLLKPKGLLVLEETAHLASPIDELQRYYALVAEMQAHYGQELYIGRRLDGFARRAGYTVRLSRQLSFRIPGKQMAQLHAMNIATWKQDPYMSVAHTANELNRLEQQLTRLANSDFRIPPVTCTMAQLVIVG
jgi:trans-aconitate methyltransferase